MSQRWSTGIAACCLGLSACSPHIWSPPARGMPLETVRTLERGQHAVTVEGGPVGEIMWGPTLIAGSARYRVGIEGRFESSAEVSVLHVTNDSDGDVKTHRNAYSARVGAKYQAEPWLAVGFGVGGGASAAGGFISPDLGAVLAYENPYAIPFAALRGFTSIPIAPRTVDLGEQELEESGQHVHGKPHLTFGYLFSTGVRVPVLFSPRLTHAIYVALHAGEIFDAHKHLVLIGFSGGIEVVF